MSTASTPASGKDTTATNLEELCVSAVAVVNQGDFFFQSKEAQNLLEHMAPQWEARLDNFPFTLSMEDLTEMSRENDELKCEILHMGSQIAEKDRVASVFMHLQLMGIRGGELPIYVFCELKWKFTGGKWICYSYTGMRKPCSDSGISC